MGMMETMGEIGHDIVTDATPFLGSLVKPPEYKPGDPDVPLDKIKDIGEALGRLEAAIEEAAKTGYSKTQLEQKNNEGDPGCQQVQIHIDQGYFNYMHVNTEADSAPTQSAEAAIDPIIDEAKKRQLSPSDVQDLMTSSYPGAINHSSRSEAEVRHLKVGPQSSGQAGKMFQELYSTAVTLHDIHQHAMMQQIKVAIKVEDPALQADPSSLMRLKHVEVVTIDDSRYIVCDAFLDTGCSFSALINPDLIKALQPTKMRKLETRISTGNGGVDVSSYFYEICLKTPTGHIMCAGSTLQQPLTAQCSIPEYVHPIIKEEFKLSDEMFKKFYIAPGGKVPQLLIGVTEGMSRVVNPLTLNGRPGLYNQMKIFTTDFMYNHQYSVSGTVGVDPKTYSLEFDCPKFCLQQENLDSGSLAPWQTFSLHVLYEAKDGAKASTERQNFTLSLNTEIQKEKKITGTLLNNLHIEFPELLPADETVLLHIEELKKTVGEADKACKFLAEDALLEAENNNLNLAEAKQVEQWILNDSAFSHLAPVCGFHQKTWKALVENCKDCTTSNDPDAERKKELAKAIEDNLLIVQDPETKDLPEDQRTFTLVQKLVTRVPNEEAGHISVNNYKVAKKASERLVKKHWKTEILETIDRQNREYLEKDKYRVLSAEEIDDIAEGRVHGQFFCRNLVLKPDSKSTPARLISGRFIKPSIISLLLALLIFSCSSFSDTAREDRRGATLAKNNPSAKGYTPDLSENTARFYYEQVYVGADISKAYRKSVNNNNIHDIISLPSDTIRLSPSDQTTFLSVWFNSATTEGTKYPYVVANKMIDFGFGNAHMCLWCGCRKASCFCKLPESQKILLRNLFVDNVGLTVKDLKKLFQHLWDIVDTFKRFKIVLDKFYVPWSYLSHSERKIDSPASTITLGKNFRFHSDFKLSVCQPGLVWQLTDDSVRPRLRLTIFPTERGRPTGPPLELTDLHDHPMTRRVFSRLMAQFFGRVESVDTEINSNFSFLFNSDLLGRFLGIAVAQIKLRCRRVCSKTTGLPHDKPLSVIDTELEEEMKTFWSNFKGIQETLRPHPRAVIPPNNTMQYFVISHDASPLMVAGTAHAVSSDPDGNLQSFIIGSKSSLHSASVPRNEKLSCLLAVDILHGLAKSLDQEWTTGKLALITGDSTISSHLFAGETYTGDGLSRATFIRISAVLDVINKLIPGIKVVFSWLPGSHIGPVDMMTKEIAGSTILAKQCSDFWMNGHPIFLKREMLEKFVYFVYENGVGKYSVLPEHLRRTKTFEDAVLVHLAACAEPQPSLESVLLHHQAPAGLPGPERDEANLLFYLHNSALAVQTFLQYANTEDDEKVTIGVIDQLLIHQFMVTTRSGASTNKDNFSDFTPSTGETFLAAGVITRGSWDTKKKAWNANKWDPTTKSWKTFNIIKVKTNTIGTVPTRKIFYSGHEIPAPRLDSDCYTKQNILLLRNSVRIFLLDPITTIAEYLTVLGKKELLHNVINCQVWFNKSVCTWLKNKKKSLPESPEEFFLATWIQLVRSDQMLFPPSDQSNLDKDLMIYLTSKEAQDTDPAGPFQFVPVMSSGSPLMAKLILSCHKTNLEFPREFSAEGESPVTRKSVHSSHKRTRSIVLTGFFSLTCPSLIATVSQLLAVCSGCCRSKPRFYMARMGPKYVGKQLGCNAWTRISFDEIGPVLISCGPGTRGKMCKVYFYLWTCLDSRAVCFIPSLKITAANLRQALDNFCFRTGATPREIYCDKFATHTQENIKTVRSTKILPHVADSKHRNFAENRVKESKRYLRNILRHQRGETSTALGSFNIFQVQYLLDAVAYSLNSTPVSTSSTLTPAMVIWPGTMLNRLCSSSLLEDKLYEDFGSSKSASAAETLLAKYRNIIMEERNRTILAMQDQADKERLHQVKKGERTKLSIQLDDVVLTDPQTSDRLRMGRVLSVNDTGTTATVRVAGKDKEFAVNNLRILSIYRPQNECKFKSSVFFHSIMLKSYQAAVKSLTQHWFRLLSFIQHTFDNVSFAIKTKLRASFSFLLRQPHSLNPPLTQHGRRIYFLGDTVTRIFTASTSDCPGRGKSTFFNNIDHSVSYRYHSQLGAMGNIANGFKFQTEFQTDPQSEVDSGYIDSTYGGSRVVNANWLSGGENHLDSRLCVISVSLITLSFFPSVFNDMLSSLDSNLHRLRVDTQTNWIGLLLIAAFVASLLVVSTLIVVKKLLANRTKLRREVKTHRGDTLRRPHHLNIEMPRLENQDSPRRGPNANFEF